MKKDRQELIRQIIKKNEIETQEELAEYLTQAGVPVTQATISRDIRELRLTKVVGVNRRSKYAEPQDRETDVLAGKFSRVLKEAFVSAEAAGTLLVIKTMTGMAMAVAASLDSLGWPEIIGCIAGDDTIFLATHSAEQSRELKGKLTALIQ